MPLTMMRARRFVVSPRFAALWLPPVAVLAAVVALGAPAGATAAIKESQARVVPPVGPLYDVLSAAWWKYAVALPAATNPLLDADGKPEADCNAGQAGPVFFLAGKLGGGSVKRTDCTVPANRALFFPVLDSIDIHIPAPFPENDTRDTPELLWAHLEAPATGFVATSLWATVDTDVVANLLDPSTTPYHACVGPVLGCFPRSFSVTFPDSNVFGVDGIPAGTYGPAVAKGFYLLLAPLKPGMHTITFGGEGRYGGTPVSEDITYRLRVLP
jgi:hypothetical protein